MSKNMLNVLFILGVLYISWLTFGGAGLLVSGLVLLMRGDKREKL